MIDHCHCLVDIDGRSDTIVQKDNKLHFFGNFDMKA